MRRISRIAGMLMLLAAPLAAQDSTQAKPTAAKPAEESKETDKRAPAPAMLGQSINVRLEFTITDQRGDVPAISKTVSLVISDGHFARIRTGGDVRTPMGIRPVILNVDARPVVMPNNRDRVRVELSIEYRPIAAEAESEKSTTPSINESLTVILEDGKPLVVSQSADPATDRRVKVEAKATILR